MDINEYYQHAKDKLFPKLKASDLSIVIVGEPDPKLCMEVGANVLFDKPIVLVVPFGRNVPGNLIKVARKIIYGDINDEVVRQQLQEALLEVVNDLEAARA